MGNFHSGYLGMYDISYGDAWSGDGEELLKKIRSLVRGKFEPRYPEKGRAKKNEKVRPPAKKPLPAIYNKSCSYISGS